MQTPGIITPQFLFCKFKTILRCRIFLKWRVQNDAYKRLRVVKEWENADQMHRILEGMSSEHLVHNIEVRFLLHK